MGPAVAVILGSVLSVGRVSADYVPPPEERLFARSSAIVDATVSGIDAAQHAAIQVHEVLRGSKAPSVLKGGPPDCGGKPVGRLLKQGGRYILVLYADRVHQYFPIRVGARGSREVLYEGTWIALETFARRVPKDIQPGEKDPRRVLAALSVFGADVLARADASVKADPAFMRIAVRITGHALQYGTFAMRSDPDIVLAGLWNRPYAFHHAGEDLWKDRPFVLRLNRAVPPSVSFLKAVHPTLRDDRQLVIPIVQRSGDELAHASPRLRKDRDVVAAAGFRGLPHADLRWRDDKAYVLSIVKRHGNWLQAASERLKKDRQVVLTAVSSSGPALECAAPPLRADRRIVLAAVRSSGGSLRAADESLRKDRRIVLAAVGSDGRALRFAAPELRRDPDVCLAAVRQNGQAVELVDPRTPGYRRIALAAVRQDGRALRLLPPEHQKDREVALAAVRQFGGVLGYAPLEIRRDREVVLAAAGSQVTALAGAGLRADPELILEAAKRNVYAIAYATGKAREDPRVQALADDRARFQRAIQRGEVYAFGAASKRLRSDADLVRRVLAACRFRQDADQHLVPEKFWRDRRFMLGVVRANPGVLRHAPWHVRADRELVLAAVGTDGLAFAHADRTVRGDKAIVLAALRSAPQLIASFDRLARGGIQWDPDVQAEIEKAMRRFAKRPVPSSR